MKRFLSILLTLVVIMTSFTVSASADDGWKCPSCSQNNSGKFCTSCGTEKPVVNNSKTCQNCGYNASGNSSFKFCPQCGKEFTEGAMTTPKPTQNAMNLEITNLQLNKNGTVTMDWTDSLGTAPYTIKYQYYVDGDINAGNQLNQLIYTAEENWNATSYTLSHLVPGTWYWIMLYDAQGNMTYISYRPEEAPNFPEFGVTMSMNLRSQKGSNIKDIDTLSSSDIKRRTKYTYGAYIKLSYSQLRKTRNYVGHVAITAPDGTVLSCDYWDKFKLPAGRSYTYWNLYSFDVAFDNAEKLYGEVPVGKYTWSLYFDGQFVCSRKFSVGP